MWRQSNAWRRLGATVAAVACVSPPVSLGGYGQSGAPPAPAVAPAATASVDPSPPTPAASMAAFNAVDSWVREWRTPMDPSGQAPLAGASVTCRYEGSIVGRGVAFASDPAGGTGILIFAVKRAMDEASERLPIQRDALMEESLKAAAGRMAITVELAGRPVPVSPAAWSELVELVPPGLEGVLVRIGERVEAMFPETMLCTGTDAAAAGRALVAKLSGDPALSLKEPKELREKHGVQFYRFKVSVVGQAREGKAPEFFTRGGRIVRIAEMTEDNLKTWADWLAAHLALPLPKGDDGAVAPGPLNPVNGKSDPEFSDLRTSALVAAALLRYSRMPGVDFGMANNARLAGMSFFDGLGRSIDSRSFMMDPATAALAQWGIRALIDPPPMGFRMPEEQVSHASFRTLWRMPQSLESDGPRVWVEDTWRGPEAGLIAHGLAATLNSLQPTNHSAGLELAVMAVRRTFVNAPPRELVSRMPWLGWAQLSLTPAGEVPTAAALREMRSEVWQHQLRAEGLPPDAQDMAGGIVFTSSPQPLPTWQAARPLAFIATMLGDPRLTEEHEVSAELVRLLNSLRFLRQLTAASAEAHMYKDPARAIGGVRASLFDQRMPPEATAMTLLTVCETIRSLEAIKQRQAPKK